LHSGVRALNRWDAEVWYSSSEWAVWRSRFAAAEVSLSPIVIGRYSAEAQRSWLPWGECTLIESPRAPASLGAAFVAADALQWTLWCAGLIFGSRCASVRDACEVLHDYDIELAAIAIDSDERVVCCTTFPGVPDNLLITLAMRILDHLD
jgi:hypothetical protein